jgi:hypothetical protein
VRNSLFAVAVLVCLVLASISEARNYAARPTGRRGSSQSSGVKTGGFPKAGAALSKQTLRAGQPGWYFPDLRPIEPAALAPRR